MNLNYKEVSVEDLEQLANVCNGAVGRLVISLWKVNKRSAKLVGWMVLPNGVEIVGWVPERGDADAEDVLNTMQQILEEYEFNVECDKLRR